MTLREQIIMDVMRLPEQEMLRLVLEFVRNLNQTALRVGNRDSVLAFAGARSPSEGDRIARDLADDFNKIEGEW